MKSGVKALALRLAGPARQVPYLRVLLHRLIARYPQLARPLIRLVHSTPVTPFAEVLDIEQQSARTRAVHAQLVERLGKGSS